MRNLIDNKTNTIYSCDIINRIAELQELVDEQQDRIEEIKETLDYEQEQLTVASIAELEDELAELQNRNYLYCEKGELADLNKLAEEASSVTSEWEYGVSLIRDSHFKKHTIDEAYAIEESDKLGYWPFNCIDWDKATEELRADYTSIDFDGVTYLVCHN